MAPHVLPIEGDSLELGIQLPVQTKGEIRVAVRRTPDEEQHSDIIVDFDAEELRVDTSHAGGGEDAWRPFPIVLGVEPADHPVQSAPFAVPDGEGLRLRVFVDRSIIEVFANERLCMTARCYPSREDAKGVALSGQGATAVAQLEAWPLQL